MKKAVVVFILVLMSGVTPLSLFSWEMTELYPNRPYYIQSAMNYGKDENGYWDMPGYPDPIEKGTNIAIYEFEDHKDRKYYMVPSSIIGYYEIRPGWERGIRVDVQGGGPVMHKNGANIHTWEDNGGDWQKFRFKHLGKGRFKIYTTTGMVLCLEGSTNENDTNVHIWEDHDEPYTEWYLIDVQTKEVFVPREIEPYSKSYPEYFARNRDKTFTYVTHLAFAPGSTGTARVKHVTDSKVTLSITEKRKNPRNGKEEIRTFGKTLNFKNGKFKDGEWDCAECGEGTVTVYPDGKQILELRGEQHVIEFILEASSL